MVKKTRNNLKTFRTSLGLRQEEMAEKLGVSIVTYNYIETGKRDGSISFWTKLQEAFNISSAKMWNLTQLTDKKGE